MTRNDLHSGNGVRRKTSSSFCAYSSCGKQRRLFKLWCLIHELMEYLWIYILCFTGSIWIASRVQGLWLLCGCYAIQIQPKVVMDVMCIKFRKLPSNCWKQKMAACVPPNLPEKVVQLRIQSTPHWCQASLLCHQLMVILRKELWWNLGIAKHLQMNDQSSRLRSRNFMKVKDQLLPLAIHPWNPIFYRRSMRIVWQQRPVKLVL